MQITGTIPQAVSVAEFKRALHVMVDDTDDDTLFDALLIAAQDVVETGTNRPMTPRTAVLTCRSLGYRRWFPPVAPVTEITAVAWNDAGAWVELGLVGVHLEQHHDTPQIVFPEGYFDGVSDGAELRVTAQIGPDAVDRKLAQAVMLVASDWYEAGIEPDKDQRTTVSFGSRALMKQNRYLRPCEWEAV